MRNICARCLHWEPPREQALVCDAIGRCQQKAAAPGGPGGGQSAADDQAGLTGAPAEACGVCDAFSENPHPPVPAAANY